MHSFTLPGVTTPVLYKMLEELRAGGNTVLAGSSSSLGFIFFVQGSGIIAQVDYYPGNLLATVTIQDKPFLVPYSLIEQKVREALRVASSS